MGGYNTMIKIADGEVRPHSTVFMIHEDYKGSYVHEGRIRKAWSGFKVGRKHIERKFLQEKVFSKRRAAELTMKLMKPKDNGLHDFDISSMYPSMMPTKNGRVYSMSAIQQATIGLGRGISASLDRQMLNDIMSGYGRLGTVNPLRGAGKVCNLMETVIRPPMFRSLVEEKMDEVVHDFIEHVGKFKMKTFDTLKQIKEFESGLRSYNIHPTTIVSDSIGTLQADKARKKLESYIIK